jgi:hypothetical protein
MTQVYANEADVLNVALFGMTAKLWRDSNPELKGNIRDYANVSQLVCLANMENLNALFINEGMSQSKRLEKLNSIAIGQMEILIKDHRVLSLEEKANLEERALNMPRRPRRHSCPAPMSGCRPAAGCAERCDGTRHDGQPEAAVGPG